jgi:hypothetical protein
MAGNWSLKQVFLRTLIATVVAGALIGIYVFLFGDFGETEARILLTTLTISYFSVTSLACSAAFESRKAGQLAPVGLAVSMVGFLVFMPGIWVQDCEWEAYGKLMLILGFLAFSIAQACLLALVPLGRSVRWIFFAVVAVIFTLASLISGMVVFDTDCEWCQRIAGVLGILDGCGSLVIPVLYKLGGTSDETIGDGSLDRIELVCPRCGRREIYAVGAIKCEKCSLRIRVEVLQGSSGGTASK